MNFKIQITIIVMIISLLIISSCNKSEETPNEPVNHPPEIENVSLSPATIKVNEITNITCVATDEDCDKLEYSWSSEAGTFPDGTTSSSVKWKAPVEEGAYKITVIVSDGKKTDKTEKTIVVEKEDDPILVVTPKNLEFGSDETQLNFSLAINGTGIIQYNISSNASWISISPSSGSLESETDNIDVLVNRTALSPGEYSDKIIIISNIDTAEVSITMSVSDQNGSIEGKIFQLNTSIPISGVLVEAGDKSSTTTESGTYSLQNIAAGEVTLKATKSDYEVYEETITIIANQTVSHNIYMTGSVQMTNIEGSVWEAITLSAIEGVKITIADQTDYTDASGHYQLPNVPQGLHTLKAEKENYFIFEGETFLSSSNKTFNIELDYIFTELSGTVKDNYTGELLKDVKINIGENEVISDQNGYFQVLNLNNKQTYTVKADDKYYKYLNFSENISLDRRFQNYNIFLLNSCEGTLSVTYEDKIYNTISIGDQCWLKENMNVGNMIAGGASSKDNDTIEKYCYNNDPNNCEKFGGLYRWNEAMQYSTISKEQGICPYGWHIPSLNEFKKLQETTGDKGNDLLKQGQQNGSNTSGFSALLAGYLNSNNIFYTLGDSFFFWSSTHGDYDYEYNYYWDAYYMQTTYDNLSIWLEWVKGVGNGLSVRCLKD